MTPRRLRRIGAKLICGLGVGLLLVVEVLRAQEAPPSEYQIKAAFLFNFAKFVEWPAKAFATPTSPLIIGVLGDNPFGDDLERTVRGKSVNNHPLVIREKLVSITDATNCHVIFISSSESKQVPELLDAVRNTSVLTVSEMEHFTDAGGMINFVLEANKIRFQINDDAAKKAGLKISSKLLSLAVQPSH